MKIDYLANHEHLIHELAELHFSEWGGYRSNDSIDVRIERLRSCCGKKSIPSIVVAIDGSELYGSAMLVSNDMDTRPDLSPWLAGVYVKAKYRKNGIGSALVNHMVEKASDLGLSRLYLCTDKSEALYTRLGWSTVEQSQYKGISVMVMTIELPPNYPFKPNPLRSSP